MGSQNGPRLATTEEFDDILALLDRCFRFERGGMRARLPFAYDPYRPDRHAVVVEDGNVIAHAALIPQMLVAGSAEIDCPGIGGVGTHPEYRGAGHMSALVEFWLDTVDSEGVSMVELGGDRYRYGHFSFENAGREFRYQITRRSFPSAESIDVRSVTDNDALEVIHELRNDEPYRVRRDCDRDRLVLNRRGLETLVVGDDAYLAFTRDRSDAEIVEFGGNAEGIEALLGHVFSAYGVSSVTAFVPPNHRLDSLFRRLSNSWRTTLLRKVCIRDLSALLRNFQPQLADRWRRADVHHEGAVVLALEGEDENEDRVRIRYTKDDLQVESIHNHDVEPDISFNRRDMTHLLFGFPDHSIPERDHDPALSVVLPLAYYIWSSERV